MRSWNDLIRQFHKSGNAGRDTPETARDAENGFRPSADLSDYDRAFVRLRITFHGTVTGVGFRYRAQLIAARLGLTGWVQNQYDESVLMEVQGQRYVIDQMIFELRNQRWIEIRRIDQEELDVIPGESSFRIIGY